MKKKNVPPSKLKQKHEKYAKEEATLDFISKLKFIELRYHLGGSITPDVAIALNEKLKVPIPSTNKKILKSLIRLPPGCKSLPEFLKHFELPDSMLQTKEAISEAVYLVQEHVKKNKGIYLELRFCPQLHLKGGLTQKEVIEAALEGMRKSKLKTNLILCMMRGENTHELNLETVELCKEFLVADDGVVALDLAGDDKQFSIADYEKEFKLAKDYQIPLTITEGESSSPENIKKAIEFGAKRIGHGLTAAADEETIKLLKEKDIILELCPFSSFCTNCSTIDTFPFKKFLDAGIKMCLNTDDIAIFGTHLTSEFAFIVEKYKVTKMQLLDFLYTAIDGAFTNEDTKDKLKKQLDQI